MTCPHQMPMAKLSGTLPLYHQVSVLLEEMIFSQQFRPGDKFPTELELAKRFHVSRPTINKAINLLMERGFLVRERGRGTYVARRKEVRLLLMEQLSFPESVEDGLPFRTEPIEITKIRANNDLLLKLNLRQNDEVVIIKRVRYIEDEPVAVVNSYLPGKLFPGIENQDFRSSSLYQLLKAQYGVPITHAERFLRCTRVYDQATAQLLGVKHLDPVLDLEGIAYSGSTKVEYYRATLRDNVVLHSRISARFARKQKIQDSNSTYGNPSASASAERNGQRRSL